MKRYILLAGITLLFLLFPREAPAQKFRGGGGFVFKSSSDYHEMNGGFFGINLTGSYNIASPLFLSPGFTFVIPYSRKHVEPTSKEKETNYLYMFDADVHYVFHTLDRFEIYGLGGINLSVFNYRRKLDIDEVTIKSSHGNAYPGLNLGAGGYMHFNDQIDFFAEARFIVAKPIQFAISGGILLNIGWFTGSGTKQQAGASAIPFHQRLSQLQQNP